MIGFIADQEAESTFVTRAKERLSPFWLKSYKDRAFINGWLRGQALLQAQLRLRRLELAGQVAESLTPRYQRVRWGLLLLDEATRNLGPIPRAGLTPPMTAGPQPDSSRYVPGSVVIAGTGGVSRAGYIGYRLPEPVPESGPSAVSSGVSGGLLWVQGQHFFVENGVIYFRNECDPFAGSCSIISTSTSRLAVIWGSDLLYDAGYADAWGAVLGLRRGRAALDTYASVVSTLLSLTWLPNYTQAVIALGALVRAPVSQSDETVLQLTASRIITDHRAYDLGDGAVAVAVGDAVTAGTPLTDGLTVYRGVEIGDTEMALIQQLRIKTPVGVLGFGNDAVDITYIGDDANGNPKYQFPLFAEQAVQDAFFAQAWAGAEALELDASVALSPWLSRLPPYTATGVVCGRLRPLEYYLRIMAPSLLVAVVKPGRGGYSKVSGAVSRFLRLLPLNLTLALQVRVRTSVTTDAATVSTTSTYSSVSSTNSATGLSVHNTTWG